MIPGRLRYSRTNLRIDRANLPDYRTGPKARNLQINIGTNIVSTNNASLGSYV
jgi:hypothetical protein